jgi:hypothetical protein
MLKPSLIFVLFPDDYLETEQLFVFLGINTLVKTICCLFPDNTIRSFSYSFDIDFDMSITNFCKGICCKCLNQE